MNLQIVWKECQKAWKSPIFLILVLVFLAFNIFLIESNSHAKEELKMANELAETYGLQITEESLQRFERDIQLDMKQLEKITGKNFTSIYEFLKQTSWEAYNAYSEEEKSFFDQLQLKEMYLNIAKNLDTEYNKLNMEGIAESTINMYGLSGKPAEMIRKEYGELDERFEEIKEAGEHKQWAFAGVPYKMHSLLFREIFNTLIFETIILIVLATAFITNYEFEHKTHLLSYSTKRGRGLMKDKLVASLIIATTVWTILLAVTLGTYFTIFDYAYLWNSPISSSVNWENKLPYITWWNIPFIEFLTLVIVLMFSSMLLFTIIVFTISIFAKNSYLTFFIFAILFVLGYLMSGFMPTSSPLIIYAAFNLSMLVMNPHMLFSGQSGLGTNFQYYEVITIIVSAIFVIVTSMLALKVFKKQEIQ